jgi:hypothetical protein
MEPKKEEKKRDERNGNWGKRIRVKATYIIV